MIQTRLDIDPQLFPEEPLSWVEPFIAPGLFVYVWRSLSSAPFLLARGIEGSAEETWECRVLSDRDYLEIHKKFAPELESWGFITAPHNHNAPGPYFNNGFQISYRLRRREPGERWSHLKQLRR